MDIRKIIMLIAFIMLLVGVIFIYDARQIATKKFEQIEINKKTKSLKILGFIIAIIGCNIILFIH